MDLFSEFDRLVKSGDPQELEFGILGFGRFIHSGEQSVIDAALLKLTDLFVNVGNEFRLLIVDQVEMYRAELNQCQLVASQVLRKLTYIWESNDHIAKVSVIRIFGLLPKLVKDSSESLYRVIVSLDSHLLLLRRAALDSSKSLASASSKFVELYIAKLSSMQIPEFEYLEPLKFAFTAPRSFSRALSLMMQSASKNEKVKELLYTNALHVEFAAKLIIEHKLLPQEMINELNVLF